MNGQKREHNEMFLILNQQISFAKTML